MLYRTCKCPKPFARDNEGEVSQNFEIPVRNLLMPCVYVFESPDGSVTYVGMSAAGLARPFQPGHAAHKTSLKRDSESIVRVMPFRHYSTAQEVEAELIHNFHPPVNKVCPRCNHYSRRKALQTVIQNGKDWYERNE